MTLADEDRTMNVATNKKPFVDGLAVLHFHVRGTSTMHEWSIGCDSANDTEETIKAHLARWRPECELDWVEIRPWNDDK